MADVTGEVLGILEALAGAALIIVVIALWLNHGLRKDREQERRREAANAGGKGDAG